jgi:hypothetical protein
LLQNFGFLLEQLEPKAVVKLVPYVHQIKADYKRYLEAYVEASLHREFAAWLVFLKSLEQHLKSMPPESSKEEVQFKVAFNKTEFHRVTSFKMAALQESVQRIHKRVTDKHFAGVDNRELRITVWSAIKEKLDAYFARLAHLAACCYHVNFSPSGPEFTEMLNSLPLVGSRTGRLSQGN